MTKTYENRTISISIQRDWREVYDFACIPENFARWASGLATSLHKEGGQWIADGPDGRLKVRFTPRNEFGVLDHYISLPSGAEIYMPLRVIANGTGAELTFTLFRQPGMTGEIFVRDAEWIAKDLRALKALLES